MIDKIEFSVNAAEEYVEKGNRQLVKANKARRALRKKYFIIVIIVLIVGAIAVSQFLRLF